MVCWSLIGLLVLSTLLYKGCHGIKLLKGHVPPHRLKGEDAHLICDFDLEDQTLYAVKWYKDDNEFFRYVPSENRFTQTFYIPGVHVDMRSSTEKSLILKSVGLRTAGLYRCEVSGEAPMFQSVTYDGKLAIIVLPETPPTVSGGMSSYHIDEEVNVNCTSSKSKPVADLDWFINGAQAPREYIMKYPAIIDYEGLEVSILNLRFKVDQHHFKNSQLRLKCTATIATIYWQSDVLGHEDNLVFNLTKSSPNSCSSLFLHWFANFFWMIVAWFST